MCNVVTKTIIEITTSDLDKVINRMFPLAYFYGEPDSELHRGQVVNLGCIARTDFFKNTPDRIAKFLRVIGGKEDSSYMLRYFVQYLVYLESMPEGEIIIVND